MNILRLAAAFFLLCGAAPVSAVVDNPRQTQLRFVPPKSRKAVRGAFWETMFRLERKQMNEQNSQHGRKNLVERIRDNLHRLSPRQQTDTMLRFLRIAYHYRGKEDPQTPSDDRAFHSEKFFQEVDAYSRKAEKEFLSNRDDTYVRLFSDIRSLASAGTEGLRLSRDLTRIDPQNALLQGRLAQDYLNVGDLEEAVAASQRAIRLNPTRALPFTTMASAKYSLGDLGGAHEAAASALLLDPGDKIAYSIMKLTKSRSDDGEESGGGAGFDGAPVTAFDLAPEDAPAKDAVQALTAGAAGRLLPARALSPGAVERLRASKQLADQARMEIRDGNFKSALRLTGEALAKDPENTSALFRRAHANYRLKRFDQALGDTSAAVALMGAKPNPILLMLHARILNSLDRPQEALAAVDRALATGPAADIQAKLLFQKAWSLVSLDHKEDALHTLAQAARLDGRYIPYYQEALELPNEADWTVIFRRELAAEAPRYTRNAVRRVVSGRMAMILLLTLMGGFLVALGVLHVFGGRSGAASGAAAGVGIAPPHSELLGGTYRISRKIGVGGMGVVYEALDVNLQRSVAIKKLRDEISRDPRERERFIREARTVALLRHPNIVQIHTVVADPADTYLVFELVDGHTVGDYIHHYKRLALAPALRILEGTAAGLEFAHRNGVVHRDLKPSNIMISRENVVKVMDFGVARQAKDAMLSKAYTISGTPPYMAPEQDEGKACAATDVFAMAVCLYELVTGVLPFNGTSSGMALAKLRRTYTPASKLAPDLPAGFDQVMAWGLEPDPSKRCPSPAKFVQGFQALA
ncbi:MAG: protein kinase [Elusimicrobiota bacterium]